MKQEIVTFRFDNPLTTEEQAQAIVEFADLMVEIRNAMVKAEHNTTNQIRNSILKHVREKIDKYIRLRRISASRYEIIIESETLRAFDVSMPINGVQTTARQLAERIGKDFMRDVKRIVSFRSVGE